MTELVHLGEAYRCPACRKDLWIRGAHWNTYVCQVCGTVASMAVDQMEIFTPSGPIPGEDDSRVRVDD